MGQYQQWLYYQEVDRRLRADLEELETELAQIQEQLRTLELTIPPIENIIIRALAASLNGHTAPSNEVPERPSESTLKYEPATPHSRLRFASAGSIGSTSSSISDKATDSSSETISPALYGWGGLPNFGPQDMQEPLPHAQNSVPLTPHPEMALLPDDMLAFFDAHDQTEPQLELPWWLSKIAASANGPIDKESIRTNHLVQRWRERWGRPVSTGQASENSEDTANE